MTTFRIVCSKCGGRGSIELTGIYGETLDLLRKQRREINASNLSKLVDGCTIEAMANRLVRLEQMGLAVGRRNGRERLWKASK